MTNPTHTLASPYLELQATPDEGTVVAHMPSGREHVLCVGVGVQTIWVGTLAEYNAIAVKDANTQYNTDAGVFVGTTLVSGGGGGLTTPLFVETLISCGMTAFNAKTENATIVVSGVAGERTLTYVSGSLADFFALNPATLAIPAVLEDSTGKCWFVMVDQIVGGLSATAGASIQIDDVLPVSVTNATLYNKHKGTSFGEHLSTAGYKALANHVYRQNPAECAIGNLQSIYSIDADDDWASTTLPYIWQLGGTEAAKSLTIANLATNNYTNEGWVFATKQRSHKLVVYNAGSALATAKVPLDGMNSGFIVLEVAHAHISGAPVTITVYASSKTDFSGSSETTKTLIYTGVAYRNVRRFVIPFSACQEIEVNVQRTVGDGVTDGRSINIGQFDVVIGSPNVSGRVIDDTDNVMVLGDSWVDPLGGHAGFTEELARLSGCSVVTGFNYTFPDASVDYVRTGQSGATTAYGLDWLQKALDANPGVNKVLIHYYVNDKNSLNEAVHFDLTAPDKTTKNYNICTVAGVTANAGNSKNVWAMNIQKLVNICVQNGVQPIVIMPGSVFSISSTMEHAIMNYMIGQPQHVQKRNVASAADLAKKWNPLNSKGKYTGKLVIDQSPGGASMLMYVANGPGNTDTWQQFGSATTITPA